MRCLKEEIGKVEEMAYRAQGEKGEATQRERQLEEELERVRAERREWEEGKGRVVQFEGVLGRKEEEVRGLTEKVAQQEQTINSLSAQLQHPPIPPQTALRI